MIETNELEPLSNDLTTITTEIKTYQSIGGQAIFEIGRRLNWVKQHDLAHGEFISWLSSIKMDRHSANHFMKIADQLQNGWTSTHLGATALYMIATMPPEERDKPQQLSNGKTKKPADMTVRELRETKRKLKEREQTIADQQAELEDNRKAQIELNQRLSEANNRQPEPKVITKTVTKEVKPDDYDTIKAKLAELEKQSAKDQEDVNYYKRELQAAERIHKNEHATDHSKELRLKRLKRDAEINAYSVSLNIDQWNGELRKVTHEDIDYMGKQAQKNLRKRLDTLQELINKINAMFDGPEIIEGEINHG